MRACVCCVGVGAERLPGDQSNKRIKTRAHRRVHTAISHNGTHGDVYACFHKKKTKQQQAVLLRGLNALVIKSFVFSGRLQCLEEI